MPSRDWYSFGSLEDDVPGFLTALQLEEIGQDRWRLLSPLWYASALLPEMLIVPSGFETDLESVPRWLPITYSRLYGSAHAAGVVHDYLYTYQYVVEREAIRLVSRRLADDVLYEAVIATGQPAWKAKVIWAGVRVGGWSAWKRKVGKAGGLLIR